MYKLGLINGNVYRDGSFTRENIYIEDGVIKVIVPQTEILRCETTIDCTDRLILPGFIDPHVHLNLDLGEFKSVDDYESGSIAAAFGGITTFIDFLEPIKYVSEFEEMLKQKMIEAKVSHIDYSFHTTVGNFKDQAKELVNKTLEKGLPSIKLFTTYSDSDRRISYEKLKELLNCSARSNVLILVHAENDEIIKQAEINDTIEEYELSRPAKAEIVEIEKLAELVKETGGKMYIVHLTCGTSIEMLKTNYTELLGRKILIESCPQYFLLTKDLYQNENGRLYLLAPPLRSSKEQQKLRENIESVHTIGTDHCPFKKEEKLRYHEVSKVPKGLGGIEFSFPLMYHLFGTKVIDKFTINPAKIHGLFPKKGIIQEGSDADIVIFDPVKEMVIDSGHSKSDYSPYEGLRVKGVVESTIIRGEFLVKEREFVGGTVKGKFLKRKCYNA
ncbi:MAG: dihydroorotase [Candidatus Heimdallarchaeaceae archaeon]